MGKTGPYENLDVGVEPEARCLRVRLALRNRSREAVPANTGFCLGWQVYDPDTAMFIAEGEWTPLEGELAAGGRRPFDLRVALPAERGRYHVYVSPRAERDGWYYQRGWPFLLLEAEVDHGRLQLLASRVTTLEALRRGDRLRSLGRLFSYPIAGLWRHRALIASMARRDIAARYRGSVFDALWTILHPLLLMLTYFFVFGVVLQARFGTDPSRSGFVLYFLAGLLPWLPFSEALARAPGIIREHRNFVKKLVFPVETLTVHQALAALATEAFALVVFLMLLVGVRGGVPATILWLPLILVPQLLLTLGFGWFLAALGVILRDLGQIIGFLLTLGFFLTPICYPEASLPAAALSILEKNPLFVLVRAYRAVLLEGHAPGSGPLVVLWLAGCAAFFAGHAFFYKLRRSFPDVV